VDTSIVDAAVGESGDGIRTIEGKTMKRLLRWIGMTLGIVVGLAALAYGVAYLVSERALQRVYDVPRVALSVPGDAPSIEEGRRLATIHGCYHGCHGKEGQGAVLFDQPLIARLVAPNLTTAVHKYNESELAAIIRNGIRPDGHSVIVMPSRAFVGLTDADLARIIAFLKSLPERPGPGPSIALGPLGRIGVATGKFKTEAQLIAETVPPPEVAGEQPVFGRYLARTICAHCHGTDLRGDSNPDFTSPTLRVVAAYSPDAFTALLRDGVALGDRPLKTMRAVARAELSELTDAEIAALYAYLHAMPDPSPAPR
jgi:cytochrome c553